MLNEIEVRTKTGKFAAQRMIEKSEVEKVGKVGVGETLLKWGNLTSPIWGTALASSLIHPVLGVIVFPVAVIASITGTAIMSQNLKTQMYKVRLEASTEVSSMYGTPKALPEANPTKQLLSASLTFLADTYVRISGAGTLVRHVDLTNKAPLRNGGFIQRFKSLFKKQKAYVDASQIGEGFGFVLEYTYHMMKLTEVRKVYLLNEEQAWEEAFRISTTV